MAPAAKAQLLSKSAFHPSVSGLLRSSALRLRPLWIYGPGYFYNGIFLGMGPGPAGAMATAGASIASMVRAEAATTARRL